jgi:hypothetical protein
MLRLSGEVSDLIEAKETEAEIQKGIDHTISTIVRPALIDLVDKIEKEKSNGSSELCHL